MLDAAILRWLSGQRAVSDTFRNTAPARCTCCEPGWPTARRSGQGKQTAAPAPR